jgi:hypothetical protein
MDSFDTLEGIKEYLKDGLSGFNRLLADRGNAAKSNEKGERRRLKTFWLLGRWQVDTFGQCHLIQGTLPIDSRHVESIPDIVEDLWVYLPEDASLTTSIVYPPKADAVCAVCGVGWTLEDAQTARWYYRDEKFRHKACQHQEIETETLNQFKEAFNKADPARKYTFNPIPNEYCTCELCTAWYEVRVAGCKGFVKVGWRKRVVNLDWSANGASVEVSDDNVTKGPSLIHAWGYDKLTEYLKVLLPSLTHS